MRVFRARSSIVTSLVLAWQLVAVLFVPAALCCRKGDGSTAQGQSASAMADCPMHHEEAATEPSCPLHSASNGTHECDCPTLGCAQTDNGFMALYGPIGVLPAPTLMPAPLIASDPAAALTPSAISLAPVPVAPPPRA
ncbi:MAG: hypothetical protein ND807_03195 [Vicinamibacterales bacterium]|nr:hypothetical protein [Vicinamibacterales bacterium]